MPTDVKETAERISTERLEEMLADAISERDRPIIGDGSLYDFAPSELVTALTELLSSRHADAQEGGEASDTKNTVSDELPPLPKPTRFDYDHGGDMGVPCYSEAQMTAYAKKALRASIPGGVGVDGGCIGCGKVAHDCECVPQDAAPSNPVVWDAMVERAARVLAGGLLEPLFEADAESEWQRIADITRDALIAALSVKPQIGSDKP